MSPLDKNLKKSRIGFKDETGSWYGLDNAAVIMPAVSDRVTTSLFRFSATIDRPVRVDLLQSALERVAARFPYYVVVLRRGFFWHYLEPYEGHLRIEADPPSPCQGFNMHRRGTLLFRVRARSRRIACEFSHILTDGTGGMRFLKNLLIEYFRLRDKAEAGVDGAAVRGAAEARAAAPQNPDIYDLDSTPEAEEHEDAYNRYFPGSYPFPDQERPAYRIDTKLLPAGEYRIICGLIPLAAIRAKAKEHGASLTEFLTAAYLDALQGVWLQEKARGRRPRPRLSIEVPVNMRRFFATRTNRNFSLFVHASLDLRLGPREFADIVSKVHHQLRYEIDAPGMARHIARNVKGGRLFAVRVLPLFLKDFVMRALYSHFGDNVISGVLSNMGPVEMPESAASRIDRFDFYATPSQAVKTQASVLSWKGSLYFSFGSLGRSREVERLFFTRLRALGVPVRVECNL
jgi:NRPS condensation-like uncharacterized protein